MRGVGTRRSGRPAGRWYCTAVIALAVLVSSAGTLAAEIVPLPDAAAQPWQANRGVLDSTASEMLLPPHAVYAGVQPDAPPLDRPLDHSTPVLTDPVLAPDQGIRPPHTVTVDERSPYIESDPDLWDWHLLPDGLIYRSYLAGFKEPRLHSFWAHEEDLGWVWDIALGGRVGLVRYGNTNDAMPDGWQIDLEGAAFPRLDPEDERDLVAVDFRAGVPLTYGVGPHRTKLAYYHLSSHLGDEYLLKNPTVERYNYSRDVLVLGHSYYLNPDWRIYGEAGWAFYSDVSGEWEFQLGVDYSPMIDAGFRGSPFAAFNAHLREEVDFGGNLVAQVGWQWRQAASGHLFRLGMEYFNGKSDQFEFYDQHENKLGLALWYDY